MTGRAMRLLAVVSAWITTPHVLCVSHDLHVRWPNAFGPYALVIDLQPFGYWAVLLLPRPTMGKYRAVLVVESTIAVGLDSPCPQPTPTEPTKTRPVLVHLGPETLRCFHNFRPFLDFVQGILVAL